MEKNLAGAAYSSAAGSWVTGLNETYSLSWFRPERRYDMWTRCSYIFLDEAGNLDFSGTRYFVLTSISMRRPFPVYEALNDYKHDCLEYGLDMEYFHCAADNNHVRKGVFDLIAAHLGGMRHMSIDSLVVEKRKTGPALREDAYPEMLGHILKFVLPKELDAGAEEVIDTSGEQERQKGPRRWRDVTTGNEVSHSAPRIAVALRATGGRLLLLGGISEME